MYYVSRRNASLNHMPSQIAHDHDDGESSEYFIMIVRIVWHEMSDDLRLDEFVDRVKCSDTCTDIPYTYVCIVCKSMWYLSDLCIILITSPGDDGAGLLLKLSVEGSFDKRTFCDGRRLNLKSNTAVYIIIFSSTISTEHRMRYGRKREGESEHICLCI